MKSLGKFPDPFIAEISGQPDAIRRSADRSRRPTSHARASGGSRTGTDHRLHRDGELVRRVLPSGNGARGRGCAGPAHRRVRAAAFPREPAPTCRADRHREPIGRERRGRPPDRGARANRGCAARRRGNERVQQHARPVGRRRPRHASGRRGRAVDHDVRGRPRRPGGRGQGVARRGRSRGDRRGRSSCTLGRRRARRAARRAGTRRRRPRDMARRPHQLGASSAAALPAPRPRWVRSR